MKSPAFDQLVLTPPDIDLSHSPLRASIKAETYALGTFNPGLTRLPNGNLLLMVRVAEALRQPANNGQVHAIRWVEGRQYALDGYDLRQVDASDPRSFNFLPGPTRVMALTSLSWLLPVECDSEGTRVEIIHYDKIIAPECSFQQYGIEDARISLIDGTYFMTVCCVSAERHCTGLYTSQDGLHYEMQGVVLDRQNKDMLYFEGTVDGKYYALTRPMGDVYFSYPPDSEYQAGPSINLATSPDGLHWRPVGPPLIRPRRCSSCAAKVGGGSQPIRTPDGWLMLYHGVEPGSTVGIYRTYWALLDMENPSRIRHIVDDVPLLEANPSLTNRVADLMYLRDVVFTCGIADGGDHYVVASGEADLACRVTHIDKEIFKRRTG